MNANKIILLFGLSILLVSCDGGSSYFFSNTSPSDSSDSLTDYPSLIVNGIGATRLQETIESARYNIYNLKSDTIDFNYFINGVEEDISYDINIVKRLYNNDVVQYLIDASADTKRTFSHWFVDDNNEGLLTESYHFVDNRYENILETNIYTIENSSYEKIQTKAIDTYSIYNYNDYFLIAKPEILIDVDVAAQNYSLAGYLSDGSIYARIVEKDFTKYKITTYEYIFVAASLNKYIITESVYDDDLFEKNISTMRFEHNYSSINNGNYVDVPISDDYVGN